MSLEPISLDLLPAERMKRILLKVLARAQIPDESACWPLTGAGADKDGYPVVIRMVGGQRRKLRINRVIVALADGIAYAEVNQACHRCDSPPCINPAHIWHGDNSANQRDMITKGRQGRVAVCGTPSMYSKGCRGMACRAAQREASRKHRGVSIRPNGTSAFS